MWKRRTNGSRTPSKDRQQRPRCAYSRFQTSQAEQLKGRQPGGSRPPRVSPLKPPPSKAGLIMSGFKTAGRMGGELKAFGEWLRDEGTTRAWGVTGAPPSPSIPYPNRSAHTGTAGECMGGKHVVQVRRRPGTEALAPGRPPAVAARALGEERGRLRAAPRPTPPNRCQRPRSWRAYNLHSSAQRLKRSWSVAEHFPPKVHERRGIDHVKRRGGKKNASIWKGPRNCARRARVRSGGLGRKAAAFSPQLCAAAVTLFKESRDAVSSDTRPHVTSGERCLRFRKQRLVDSREAAWESAAATGGERCSAGDRAPRHWRRARPPAVAARALGRGEGTASRRAPPRTPESLPATPVDEDGRPHVALRSGRQGRINAEH
ncbi:hypothetical protein SKAU_G00203660 [Synaphobranchus kaupii]|uniref:Uncharacterized protein n=1 Tax=Synaphobranchus kaupii TaxID=118154 RepID=A0A9Q1FG99_SYNKA|nr:hypothetical protein SKAU_G00203660 [Synaphobranchus kaupii]